MLLYIEKQALHNYSCKSVDGCVNITKVEYDRTFLG